MVLETNSRQIREKAEVNGRVSPFNYDFDWGSDFDYFFVPEEGGNAGYEDIVIGGVLDEDFQVPLFDALDMYDIEEEENPLDIYLLDSQAAKAFIGDITEYSGENALFVSPDYNPAVQRPTVVVDMEGTDNERGSLGEELAHYKAFENGWNRIANEVNTAAFEVLNRKKINETSRTQQVMMSINQGIKEIFANHISYEKGGLEEVERNFNNINSTGKLSDVSDLSDSRKFKLMVSTAEDVYPQSVPHREKIIDERLTSGREGLKESLPDELESIADNTFRAYEQIEVPPNPVNVAMVESDLVNSWLLVDDNSSPLMSSISPQEIVSELEGP